jgi:hypothetical protein
MMQITRLIQYYGFCGTNEFGKNDVCSRSKKGETFFYCTVCAIDIACAHGGKSDVRRHVGTKNHIELAKVKQKG